MWSSYCLTNSTTPEIFNCCLGFVDSVLENLHEKFRICGVVDLYQELGIWLVMELEEFESPYTADIQIWSHWSKYNNNEGHKCFTYRNCVSQKYQKF